MGNHVFISYARQDEEFVLELASNLKKSGIRIWLDRLDLLAGANWNKSIDDAIYNCSKFLIVLSPAAIASRQVESELLLALDKKKLIVPMIYQTCQLPRQLLAYQFVNFTSCTLEDKTALEPLLCVLEGGTRVSSPETKNLDGRHSQETSEERSFLQWFVKIGRFRFSITWVVLIALSGLPLVYGTLVWWNYSDQFRKQSTTIERREEEGERKLSSPDSTGKESPISISAKFAAPGRSAQGIAWDGSDLWVSDNSGKIFQVDSFGKIKDAFQAPEVTPEGLAWDGASFWLFTTNHSDIVQFRVKHGERTVTTISSFLSPNQTIGGTNDGLAWDGEHFWYSDQFNVYKLDKLGAMLDSFTLGQEIAGLAWSGANLWVAHNDLPSSATLSAVDTRGNVLASYRSPVFQIEGLSADGYDLWVIGRDSLGGPVSVYHLNMSNVETLTSTGKEPPTAKND